MNAQRGVTLVELMVAMVIGLFLLLGLGTMFYTMRSTSLARQGLSALQDNERMTMTFLGASIQGAGSYPNALTQNAAAQFPASAVFAAGQTLSGTTGTTANTDSISVRFATPLTGTTNIQGCAPNPTANTVYTDVFTVDTTSDTLVCTENGVAISLVGGIAGVTSGAIVTNVAGVAGMSILYGIDTTGVGSATQYLPASATLNWSAVKTVSVTLLFNNPLAGQSGQTATTVAVTRVFPYMNGL